MVVLNIDTAIDKGSFCIVDNNEILAFEESDNRTKLAGWLHNAINDSIKKLGLTHQHLKAVAVSNGPGSYTGLKIGLATAKGLCYALNIPLICMGTLEIMANAVKEKAVGLICPMIDARRMEVFTAIYRKDLSIFQKPLAKIIETDSFCEILNKHSILFTGNGSKKLRNIIKENTNSLFIENQIDAKNMLPLCTKYYKEKMFSDVAYCEPYYVKDVYINTAN